MHVIDDRTMAELLAFMHDYQAFVRNRRILLDAVQDSLRLVDHLLEQSRPVCCPCHTQHAPPPGTTPADRRA
jgi:hypothetical protein